MNWDGYRARHLCRGARIRHAIDRVLTTGMKWLPYGGLLLGEAELQNWGPAAVRGDEMAVILVVWGGLLVLSIEALRAASRSTEQPPRRAGTCEPS